MGTKFTHITWNDRLQIEKMLKDAKRKGKKSVRQPLHVKSAKLGKL